MFVAVTEPKSAPVGPAFHALWTDPLATIAGWPQG